VIGPEQDRIKYRTAGAEAPAVRVHGASAPSDLFTPHDYTVTREQYHSIREAQTKREE
jgi:hypothetical protein